MAVLHLNGELQLSVQLFPNQSVYVFNCGSIVRNPNEGDKCSNFSRTESVFEVGT